MRCSGIRRACGILLSLVLLAAVCGDTRAAHAQDTGLQTMTANISIGGFAPQVGVPADWAPTTETVTVTFQRPFRSDHYSSADGLQELSLWLDASAASAVDPETYLQHVIDRDFSDVQDFRWLVTPTTAQVPHADAAVYGVVRYTDADAVVQNVAYLVAANSADIFMLVLAPTEDYVSQHGSQIQAILRSFALVPA